MISFCFRSGHNLHEHPKTIFNKCPMFWRVNTCKNWHLIRPQRTHLYRVIQLVIFSTTRSLDHLIPYWTLIINWQSSCLISDGERRMRTSKCLSIRDWSLITCGRGGATKWENCRSETFSPCPTFHMGKTSLAPPFLFYNPPPPPHTHTRHWWPVPKMPRRHHLKSTNCVSSWRVDG